jgi:hypothetical protein
MMPLLLLLLLLLLLGTAAKVGKTAVDRLSSSRLRCWWLQAWCGAQLVHGADTAANSCCVKQRQWCIKG